jgi:hypothetical protein
VIGRALLGLSLAVAVAQNAALNHLPDFQVPKTFAIGDLVLPVTYLETYPVKDTAAKLPASARAKICKLVSAAHRESKQKFNQDYLLESSAPFYQLLAHNYPEVKNATGESGRVIFLRDLARAVCPK